MEYGIRCYCSYVNFIFMLKININRKKLDKSYKIMSLKKRFDENKKNILFDIFILIICFLLYSINNIFIKEFSIEFFNFYFNDILGGIVIMSYTNLILQFYKKRPLRLNNFIYIYFFI